ncbi:MAG: hypothetical protein K6T73_08675 [Candidatus Bathyarchaeota archaeon]|nr:hypothetical protein [Candidatus Bathyarchaeota archaeon]
MSDRGYGYYPDEGGLYSGGLVTGGGLKSFRKGKPGTNESVLYVPSLTWGIRKLQRAGTGERLKNTKWWGFMQKALEQAKREYLASMTEAERAKYVENQKRQLAAKERKMLKMNLVRDTLEKLKGKDMRQTAMRIAEALKLEGNPKTRILRSALMILYPDLKNLDKEQRKMQLKDYRVRQLVSIPRAYKKEHVPKSYIGFEKSIKVDEEALSERISELEGQLEILKKAKEEIEQPPTPATTPRPATELGNLLRTRRTTTRTRATETKTKTKAKPKEEAPK